jgi:solute carrier family 35 protein E2
MLRTQTSTPSKPQPDRRRAHSVDANEQRLKRYETFLWLCAWYLTSLGTLLLNKIILTERGVSSQALGACQMLSTALLGAAKVWWSSRPEERGPNRSSVDLEALSQAEQRTEESTNAQRSDVRATLVALGALRGLTVVLGLVSLAHVAASFTETIKATAPIFTVWTARVVLRQRTSGPVVASLIPVMVGLVVCAHTEVSYDAIGFWAALANNAVDCLQNVLSKKIVSTLGPVKLQFYTSLLAIAFQLPILAARTTAKAEALVQPSTTFLLDPHVRESVKYILVNVCCYHAQSVSACVYQRLSLV